MTEQWTDLIDPLGVGHIPTYTEMNQLRDNMEWLASPPVFVYEHSTTGGDYTVSTTPYMEYIDSTNMTYDLTYTEGAIVMAVFMGVINSTVLDETIALDISVENLTKSLTPDRLNIHGAFGRWAGWGVEIAARPIGFAVMTPIPRISVPGDQYRIRPVWATQKGNTVTLIDDYAPMFALWEA